MGPEIFVLRQGMVKKASEWPPQGIACVNWMLLVLLKDVVAEAENDTVHETMRSRQHAVDIAQLVVPKDSTTCTAV